jgi:hypothetical protein
VKRLSRTLQFDSQITDIEKVNPLFSSCNVRVLYTGLNRNNSIISKDVVDNALGSIYNIPIVGEFIEAKDDFGGHGGKIEISDQGIKFIKTTVPYGIVPESANIYWEDVTESDGTVHNYLNIEGALLWTGRYEEASKVIEEGRPQSMEIEVMDGEFTKDKKYEIKDMVFSALAILGEDVEPCFESANITAYSFNKDDFKNEFKQMLAELNYSMKSSNKIEYKKVLQEGGKVMSEENKTAEFALTSEQLKNELRRELAKSVTEDDWGYQCQDYYYVDCMCDQNMVIARDWDDMSLVGFSYAVNGDAVSVDFDSKKRFKVEYVPMEMPEDGMMEFNLITKEQMEYKLLVKEKEVESKLNAGFEAKVSEFENQVAEKETALTELQSQFEVVKSEKEELESFKLDKLKTEKETQINAVFESVSSKLTEDELAPFKEKAFEMEIEDLKKELFVLIGQKAFESEQKFNLNNTNHVGIALDTIPEDTTISNSYDAIIKKYNNK